MLQVRRQRPPPSACRFAGHPARGAPATATVAGSPYSIVPSAAVFTPAAAAGNYSITYANGSFTVNAAPLDITATNESKTYGDTFTPNGATQFSTGSGQLKNGDVIASVTLSSAGYAPGADVAGSPYTITASAAVFTPMGANGNYAITLAPGDYTLHVATASTFPRCTDDDITVTASGPLHHDIGCDTGIR